MYEMGNKQVKMRINLYISSYKSTVRSVILELEH